jgi:CBS domain-containing protein
MPTQDEPPHEVARFLARYPPFDALEAAELETIAAAVAVRPYRTGEAVLVEDGTPAEAFYVIRDGSMELVHEDEVIDILEPGEGFGHPSLLTGLAPAFTVRAHGDSLCYLLPRETALSVLGRPAGAGFVAGTLRERLTRAGHVVHALPELGTVRVAELVARPATVCEPYTTIRHAAELMTAAGTSAILVPDGERLLILTDADLRAKVLAGNVSPENPVSRVTTLATTVPPSELAVDAVVDMLDSGVDHLVVVDEPRTVLGIVSAADLMGLETRSPFAIRHAVLRAESEEELVAISTRLGPLFLALLEARLAPADVGRVLSLQLDSFTSRLIDFSMRRHGAAPAAWAWLELGSAARREFTLGSDQDNALAFADTDDPGADAYFARLAEEVNAGLTRCGFEPDANSVLASAPLWRLPDSTWREVFRDCFESPDRSHLIRATVVFDFRHGAGGLEIVRPLVQILRDAPRHADFIRQLARTATDFKPPLGFRGSLVVQREGDEIGKLDIKRGGVLPIANLARFHAVAHGITISSTVGRLVAAEETGVLESGTAQALRESFDVLQRIRLEHHAARLEAGARPDNLIDPDELPQPARRDLREAFRSIAQAQKRLGVYVPAGI